MRYPHLPEIGAHKVPKPPFDASPNRSSRLGRQPRICFIHRWGGGTFQGVISYFKETSAQVSAHLVYAGAIGPDANKLVQMVPFSEKAWTECDFNPIGISIESADAIWDGHDPVGFAVLARMVALILHKHGWPVRWVREQGLLAGTQGFARHADGGAMGCGHIYCPTTDMELWHQFCDRVTAEYRHGHFTHGEWGKQ